MSVIDTGTSVQGLGYGTTQTQSSSALGKDDFLKLLVTQLHYQDPLNPTDGTEFSAQLAQFSSLEQLQNINDSLQQNLNANYLLTTSINNTMAATVIGHDVKAYGDQIYLGENGESQLHFDLSVDAKNIKVEILDENDQVRRTINLNNLEEGEQSVLWDGKDNAGVDMSQGNYHFRVTATDAEGQTVSSQTFVFGTISGVRYDTGSAVLMIGDLAVQMSDVYEISNN